MIQFVLVSLFFRIIRSSKLRWLMNRRFPRAFFFPRMTREEFGLLAEMANDAWTIIEYGSGGSTVYFLRRNKRVFSVDSNPGFHQLMMSIPFVSSRIGNGLNLDFVDMGPTDTWGTPLSTEKSAEWPRYVSQPWSRVGSGDRVDLVLVDGRFRVACCLYSVQQLVERGWTETPILFHDFWDRKEYHVVLPFLHELKSSGTLAAFKPKAGLDAAELARVLAEYQRVPR